MPVRLGLDLSQAACRIVELDSSARPGDGVPETRVRSFASLPREGADTHRKLSSFRGKPAAAVVWGLDADHRQAVVERRSFRRMRREAVAAMQGAGVETRGRVADIFPGPLARDVRTRSVVVAMASTPGLVSVVRALAADGLRVRSIVTPALALMSLARMRRALSGPGVEIYVALEETATALALVRDGLLVAASELEWGYQDDNGFMWPRDEIANRLAHEIERFLAMRGARLSVLRQVCICGGLPELRTMAVGLTELLDVEVETLDSLFAIDALRLPGPIDEFRDRAAGLRLAWAAAADWPAPVNLLRERGRRNTKVLLYRAAVLAGVVTGVGAAWQLQRSDWWRAAPAAPRPAQVALPASPPQARRQPPAVAQPPMVARAVDPVTVPVPVPVARPPITPAPVTSPPVTPQAVAPLPIARTPVIPPPVVAQRAVEVRVELPRTERRPVPPAPAPRVLPAAEIPLPFDAVLGTILYGPERRLALVDGRIVQIGDEINGARVVDITSTTVLLRDGQGRLRRLGLGAPGR